ncbi:MAG: lipase family protein [Lachnospiraceae bacterium]|nr:lipase family protein [Lachnospiraceae bacterium]
MDHVINKKQLMTILLSVLIVCFLSGCRKTSDTPLTGDVTATPAVSSTTDTKDANDSATGVSDVTGTSDENAVNDITAEAGTQDVSATDKTDTPDIPGLSGGADAPGVPGVPGVTGMSGTEDPSARLPGGTAAPGSVLSSVSNEDMAEFVRLYAATLEGMKPLESIDLPSDSSDYSDLLATEALSFCSQGNKSSVTRYLTASGFEILLQANYDKDPADPSHTCAFTLAKKKVPYNGSERDLLLITVRGTESGEWFSNFDFAASHSDETAFAENFLQSAQDVYVRILPSLLANPDALILVCGHSRGAACANLLGMTLDDLRSKENVYVYTFATPATIRSDYDPESYSNIFNLINPADMVTHLPLAGWGYKRIGNDIILDGDPGLVDTLKQDMDLLSAFAPTISDYYGTRHPLYGLDGFDGGITAYETMLAFASSMIGVDNPEINGLKVTDIYKLSLGSEKAGELYPLLNFLQRMVGTDGNLNLNVFKQHMPAIYRELIALRSGE